MPMASGKMGGDARLCPCAWAVEAAAGLGLLLLDFKLCLAVAVVWVVDDERLLWLLKISLSHPTSALMSLYNVAVQSVISQLPSDTITITMPGKGWVGLRCLKGVL